MKAYLMYPDRDFVLRPVDKIGQDDTVQDLELSTLWDAMSRGDAILRQVAQNATCQGLDSITDIRYRQYVLSDCLRNPDSVRGLYDLAVAAIAGEKAIFRSLFDNRGEGLLQRSVTVLGMFFDKLKELRSLAETTEPLTQSEGFARFFSQLRDELDDAYFTQMRSHLKALRLRQGLIMSAALGPGNHGTDYVLRIPRPQNEAGLFKRTPLKKPTFSFTIPDRDEAGFQALGDLRDRGLNQVANALAQSADHVLSFFVALRTELAFYIGALNLHETLTNAGGPECFPDPSPDPLRLAAHDLYDPCLALRLEHAVTSNDLDADGKHLIVITGANQGGKSTFLRSVGLAHMMMQCGLFVAATAFSSTLTRGVLTHYKREEDATMAAGKFDEELARMSCIADTIQPGALLMCNESFAATNEREGSEIATQIIDAVTAADIRVVFVTHMYDLAHHYWMNDADTTLFLRADRGENGRRTFRLHAAEPLPTSYGADLYRRTFNASRPTDPLGGAPT